MEQRLKSELEELKSKQNYRSFRKLKQNAKYLDFEGRNLLNLSSNDYLGIGDNIQLKEEFYKSSFYNESLNFSSSSSRLLTGNCNQMELLETEMAVDYGKSVLLFNSGYHVNIGILPAICTKQTLILADKLVHASIIDGIRLSEAKFIRYKHNDYNHLERLLQQNSSEYKEIIIVTESIFSMDGDCANLEKLVALKKQYNALLYLDEAHAVGVRGEKGLGLAEEFKVLDEIDILVGTFGKALASYGAWVACSEVIKNYLINKARSLIFTTALAPIQIAWTRFIWNKVKSMHSERQHLKLISAKLGNTLLQKGYSLDSDSQIVPMTVGDNNISIQLSEQLKRKGFLALPVRPPTVPANSSRIRFSLSANISLEEIRSLTDILPVYADLASIE